MDVIVSVVLPLSLAFIMFSLGLGLTLGDFARVARTPWAVAAGLAAQLLLVPATAFALLTLFAETGRPLTPELAVGVMILAVCPGGVTSNLLTKFARGRVALSVTLTGVASLAAVLTVPLFTAVSVDTFMGDAAPPVDVTALALAMTGITAVPVALGVALRAAAPALADRLDRPVSALAALLFAIIIVGALAANWDAFAANFGVLGPLLVALNIVLLSAGFALARALRLDREDAIAIALEAGLQNGTLGIAVGALLVGGGAAVPIFALPSGVYGITMYLVTLPVVAGFRWSAPINAETPGAA